MTALVQRGWPVDSAEPLKIVIAFLCQSGYARRYTYEVGILYALPSSFRGGIIREEFHSVTAGGLFTMSDINPVWINNIQQGMGIIIVSEDQVAGIIFRSGIGTEASFACDKFGQFTDIHTGPGVRNSSLFNAFTSAAIMNNKVGFQFTQDYKCNNAAI